jgi:hypothetical protein
MSDPRIPTRDAGLRRLSHLTGWIAAAALAGAGAIAVALAGTQHQATATPSDPSVSAPVGGGQIGEDPGQSQQGGLQGGLQAPLSPPLPATGGGGGPVSGGS